MGDKHAKSDENKKILYADAINLYGWGFNQSLPHDQIEFDENVLLEDLLSTEDDTDIGYLIQCDLSYPDNIKKIVHFAPKKKLILCINLVIMWTSWNQIFIQHIKD